MYADHCRAVLTTLDGSPRCTIVPCLVWHAPLKLDSNIRQRDPVLLDTERSYVCESDHISVRTAI